MKKSAFKLRSGNTTPFKEMASSPVKQLAIFKPIIKWWGKRQAKKKAKKEAAKKASTTSQYYKVGNPDKGGRGYVSLMSDFTSAGGKRTGHFAYSINPKTGKLQFDATKSMMGGKELKNVDAIIKNINKPK